MDFYRHPPIFFSHLRTAEALTENVRRMAEALPYPGAHEALHAARKIILAADEVENPLGIASFEENCSRDLAVIDEIAETAASRRPIFDNDRRMIIDALQAMQSGIRVLIHGVKTCAIAA